MSRLPPLPRLLCGAACALALCACVAHAPPKAASIDAAMAPAAQALQAGDVKAALRLWSEAAGAFPGDKTPWLRMAQLRYDGGQYGEAILDAQQVLKRDPADKLANSIIAIGALRLSTRALSELSRQNNLSGSLRSESQELATLLRANLGETVLVPPLPPRPERRAGKGRAGAGQTP